METKDAVDHLIKALSDDDGYYYSWQSNIAVQFQDAFHELHRNQGVYAISNEAAKKFLDLLIRSGKID